MARGGKRLRCDWLFVGAISLLAPLAAPAQIVIDDTFGAGGPVGPGVDPTGQPADYLIAGGLGEQRGGNLFHSFFEFSIGAGETATFTDEGLHFDRDQIHHVFARVTGENASRIDGTIRSTIDSADVWLMNPNGVVFGEGARLGVPGGFHASTATSLDFDTGEKFEVRLGGTIPILGVAAPTEFGFLGAGAISVAGDLLVPAGSPLQLHAGEIAISGKVGADGDADVVIGSNASIVAPNGEITVGTEAESVLVLGVLSTTAGDELSAGDITIRGSSVVIGETGRVSADALGLPEDDSVVTEAGAIEVSGHAGSVTVAGTVSASAQLNSQDSVTKPGNITIRAAHELTISGTVRADGNPFLEDAATVDLSGATVFVDGLVSAYSKERYAGSIQLAALSGDVDIAAGGVVFADGDGNAGRSGRVSLDAHGDVTLDGRVTASGEGDGAISVTADGDITLNGPMAATGVFRDGGAVKLKSRDGGEISIASEIDLASQESGGILTVDTSGDVRITGVIDATGPRFYGRPIEIRGRLVWLDGALLTAAPAEILIDADVLRIEASVISVSGFPSLSARFRSNGKEYFAGGTEAGLLQINAGHMELLDGARIEGSSFGSSPGGEFQITADTLILDDSSINSKAADTGAGGNIVLTVGQLTLRNGSSISTESAPVSAADIEFFTEVLSRRFEDIVFVPVPTSTGNAGSITLTAEDVYATGSSEISARAVSANGGNVTLVVASLLELTGGSAITVENTGSGNAGSITVQVDELYAEGGSKITGRAENNNGGNVVLLVGDRIHLVDSEITAQAGVDGGNVAVGIDEDDPATGQIDDGSIDPVFVILDNSRIDASAGDEGGTVQIRTQAFIANPQSVVTASSDQGPEFDGTVEINAPDVDLAGSLAQLPEAVLDASALAAQRCSARRTGETEGSFVVSGRDGAAPGPDGLLPASAGSSATNRLASLETACR